MLSTQITRDYQGAISILNTLQTSSGLLQNTSPKQKVTTNKPEVLKFLKRTGVTLEDLDKLSIIHITGTNGKGTTCAYCEHILRKHGYTTGFYSSPHLLDVRERIRINGKPISKTEFSEYFWKIFDLLDSQKENPHDMPLYFRYLTVMAFHIFLKYKVDAAIIEVGIGGEYDSTNVIRKTVIAGITPLDFDHTAILGDTLESIAWHKSGIFKEGCMAFTNNQDEKVLAVFHDRSAEKRCTLHIIDKDYYSATNDSAIQLPVQKINASLALAISEAFIGRVNNNNVKFSSSLAKMCIEETKWPGRYEIIQFNTISFFLDGAHTLDSICVCRDWFNANTLYEKKKKVLIFNLIGKRDPIPFFNELYTCNFDFVIFTPNVGSDKDKADCVDLKSPEEKQLKICEEYKSKWLQLTHTNNITQEVIIATSFFHALNNFSAEREYNVLVTGSIHLVGAALSIIDPTLNGVLNDEI